MIDYVEDYIEDNAISENFGEGQLIISAENQTWDKQTLQQLKDDYNIIFMTNGNGVSPVKIVRMGNGYGVAIGSEDDGTIFFNKSFGNYENSFHSLWIDSLIADLQAAKSYIEELERSPHNGED